MEFIYSSGFLTVSEIIIRCRLLNKSHSLLIEKYTCYNRTGKTLYYGIKHKRTRCEKCHWKCTVKADPCGWVNGLRCTSCLPKTLTHTKAVLFLKRKNRSVLEKMNRIKKMSPYGKPMLLYLFADVVSAKRIFI